MTPPDEQDVEMENEETLRTKIRLLRTALDRMTRVAEKEGLFNDEILALAMALEDVIGAAELVLERKRNGL